MLCESKEEMIENFYGEYKKNLISKKYMMRLFVYHTYIEGVGFGWYEETISKEPTDFKIQLYDIKQIRTIKINGIESLRIDYIRNNSVVNNNSISTVIIINISNCKNAMEIIIKNQEIDRKNIEQVKILEEKRREENLLKEQEKTLECHKFFDECFNFHITKNQNPYFELGRMDLQLAIIYVDSNKNLNFLRIDGLDKEESNGIIPFSKIHYYEKAGNVHYTTDIKGDYFSFGGSFTGSTFSKKATFWAGLLLGPMGMAGGALFSHKPAQIAMPSSTFNIESNVKKIDDRNVLLNYYSDMHKQFIDIELPSEIYNFFQTYLPEKKYSIVTELEKQTAVKQANNQIENGEFLKTPQFNNKMYLEDKEVETKNNLDDFKNKMKKLKTMHECGILSDREFDEEKKRILSLL